MCCSSSLSDVAPTDRDAILSGNATRIYRLAR